MKNEKIEKFILDKIKNKEWKPNQKIPNENVLISNFDVSKMTLRLALEKLKLKGILYSIKGSGIYVNPSLEYFSQLDYKNKNTFSFNLRKDLNESDIELNEKFVNEDEIKNFTPFSIEIEFDDKDNVVLLKNIWVNSNEIIRKDKYDIEKILRNLYVDNKYVDLYVHNINSLDKNIFSLENEKLIHKVEYFFSKGKLKLIIQNKFPVDNLNEKYFKFIEID